MAGLFQGTHHNCMKLFFEGLILFIILNIFVSLLLKIKNHIGLITGIFIFLYGFFRFFIEFYREPDPQLGFLYLNLTLGQMLCFIMLIIGFVTNCKFL